MPEVSLKWALTGDADVYADEAAAYDSLDAGTAQAEIRRFAAELGAAKRRVLVTTVPTPGMAEAMEQERDAYLAQMKAALGIHEFRIKKAFGPASRYDGEGLRKVLMKAYEADRNIKTGLTEPETALELFVAGV